MITALSKANQAVAWTGADLSEFYTRCGYIVDYPEEAVWVHGPTSACRCLRSCGGELRELNAAALHSREMKALPLLAILLVVSAAGRPPLVCRFWRQR